MGVLRERNLERGTIVFEDEDGSRVEAPVTERAAQLLNPGNESVGSRLALWKATWAMIHDHAALGTGYGTFYLFYPQYRLPGDTSLDERAVA